MGYCYRVAVDGYRRTNSEWTDHISRCIKGSDACHCKVRWACILRIKHHNSMYAGYHPQRDCHYQDETERGAWRLCPVNDSPRIEGERQKSCFLVSYCVLADMPLSEISLLVFCASLIAGYLDEQKREC